MGQPFLFLEEGWRGSSTGHIGTTTLAQQM
jgi:hypothetical protein